jgi:hypothetical protein
MLDKLIDQSARGFIPDAWAEEFIHSLRERVLRGYPLTDKQADKLEELFEKY